MNWKFWEKEDPLDALNKDFSSDFGAPNSTPGLPPQDPFNAPMQSSPSSVPQANPAFSSARPQYDMNNLPSGVGVEPVDEPPHIAGSGSQTNNLQYDVIIARLDGITARLESMAQRLSAIEQQQNQRQQQSPRGPWYREQR